MTHRSSTLVLKPGVCRFCGCTETTACEVQVDVDEATGTPIMEPCGWADKEGTLCSNPQCLAQVSTEELQQLAMSASHAKKKAAGR